MKFELEPNNRGASDETLLEDLRHVALILGKKTVTMPEHAKHGRFSPDTLKRRFGSWSKAQYLAGLSRNRHLNTTPQDCIDKLQLVANKLGKSGITTKEYLANGGFSLRLVARHFGSWKVALQHAGLEVSPLYNERVTDEQLFENIERVWESLGRQPKTNDFSESPSRISVDTYKRRFGSLRKALEAFVDSFDEPEVPESISESTQPVLPNPKPSRHKTSRNISWRMRFLVMRRDNFKCRITGRSPATDPKVILEVDHIVSWDKGGETVMENLQTLVKEINIGKSNLDMNNDGYKYKYGVRHDTT